MDKKWKIIFLNFDGVINGSDPIRYILFRICDKLKIKKLYYKIYKEDVYGVHERKIKRLARICHITGAYVVLTSSWRDEVYNMINNNMPSDNYNANKLVKLFKKYNIVVAGKTEHSMSNSRQSEIVNWLARYENIIKDYIIFDDEWSDLSIFIGDKLILTSDAKPGKSILGYWYCRHGLRNIHVIKAIRKLGIEKY